MPFELSEEQILFRNEVRKFAREKIAPRAAEIDAEGKFPQDIYELLCKNNLMGVAFPEEYGGGGAEFLTFIVGSEELAKVCVSSGMIPGVQELACAPLIIAGTPEQKKKYLPRLASGEWLASFCLTEPEAGSDALSMRTRAELRNGVYVLNGSKCFISNADQAKFFTVFAKTDPEKGVKGVSSFLVEKSFGGISIGKHEEKMGCRGMGACEVIFEDCEVPVENRLGQEGQGLIVALQTLDRTRPLVGVAGVGVAQAALDYAVEYAKRRIQFNKPIASFQGIQFKLADIAMEVEAARQLVYFAAATIDKMDKENAWGKGRKLQLEISKLGAMAKCFATDMAMRNTIEAAKVLGGYGYMKDYPMERFIRDARLLQIVEGTNEIQRMVIAEGLFA